MRKCFDNYKVSYFICYVIYGLVILRSKGENIKESYICPDRQDAYSTLRTDRQDAYPTSKQTYSYGTGWFGIGILLLFNVVTVSTWGGVASGG